MVHRSTVLFFLCIVIARRAAASVSSADYPLEVCLETTYWQPLPKPEGVIGYGYNAIRGPVSKPIFNITSYEGIRPCRLTVKTKPDGRMVVEGYRLPGYVEEYQFDENGDQQDSDKGGEDDQDDESSLKQLRFTLITYESTAQAFLDMRRRWGLIIDEEMDYESLFFTLHAPLRYYGGTRFRDTLQSTVREQAAAAPFYTLRVESVSGRFSMKPYRYAHFVRGGTVVHASQQQFSAVDYRLGFAQRLRDLVRRNGGQDEATAASSLFDEFGTHYPIAGTFGGIDERRIYFADYYDASCHKRVTIDLLATCDGLKLKYQYGYPNVRVLLRPQPGDDSAAAVDLDAARNETWDVCRREVERVSRTSTYVAAAGGKLPARLALHTTRRFPADFANVIAWRNWLEATPAEATTVKVRMAPICELVPIVDRRLDAKLGCKRRLEKYLRQREHLLTANPEVCDISAGKMPVAFERKPPNFWDNLLQLHSNESAQTYCVPTVSFDRTSPCPQASQQEQRVIPRGPLRPRFRPPSKSGSIVAVCWGTVYAALLFSFFRDLSVLAEPVFVFPFQFSNKDC